jgi:hypothetical protein
MMCDLFSQKWHDGMNRLDVAMGCEGNSDSVRRAVVRGTRREIRWWLKSDRSLIARWLLSWSVRLDVRFEHDLQPAAGWTARGVLFYWPRSSGSAE